MDSPEAPVYVRLYPKCFLYFVYELNLTIQDRGSAGWVWTTAPPNYACAWCWRRSKQAAVVTVGIPPMPPTDPGICMPLCQRCRDAVEAERERQEARRRVPGRAVIHDRIGLTGILIDAYRGQYRDRPRHLSKKLHVPKQYDIDYFFPDGVPEEMETMMNLYEALDGDDVTVADLVEG